MPCKTIHSTVLLAMMLISCCVSVQAQYVSSEEARIQRETVERQERDNVATSYVGKTYWYVPKPQAIRRISFSSAIPPSFFDKERLRFFPTTSTSFSVADVAVTRNSFALLDKYYLKIQFADGKPGYIELEELRDNLRDTDELNDFIEYVFSKSPQTAVADHKKSASARRVSTILRIGMTKEQVLASSWGRPTKINRTGAREQWVYGGAYLYFDKGVLTAVDK